ncbi:MAG: lipid-A-disaccharide synthase [Synergistaceae bacterium]|nr:lipid-A-disaccharide synthase [Synergistaceae bacterium]
MSAGEVSGDHYIAKVCEKLRSMGRRGRTCGLCGAESREAGIEALWESERLQLMGFAEVFGAIGNILRLLGEMTKTVLDMRPRAIVLADSPDFHLPLIRRLRRGGYSGKIFYISPPSVWAWRSYRVHDLRSLVDECLPLFSFEHEYLKKSGTASFWTGHPLSEELSGWSPDPRTVISGVKGASLSSPEKIVALLPGSRGMEIEQLYPPLSETYDSLARNGFSPVFSVAPGLSESARNFLLSGMSSSGQNYYEGPGRDLLAISKASAGASGTATAEALLLRRYMVVLYKLKPLSALIGKIFLSRLFFAIPNILAGEMFYPELLQRNATGANAARELLGWLDLNDGARAAKEARMDELASKMGGGGVYDFWAGRILEAA